MDKSSRSIPGPTHETTASVDSSHEQSSFLSTGQTAGRHFPKEDTSATGSAKPSRESSPARPIKTLQKTIDSSRSPSLGPSASSYQTNKNSSQEIRTTRSTHAASATASASSTATVIQQALSTKSIPNLHALSPNTLTSKSSSAAAKKRAQSVASLSALYTTLPESISKPPFAQKPSLNPEVKENLRWPISPRLRTPPPITHCNIISARNSDLESSSTSLRKSSTTDEEEQTSADSDPEESSSFLGMRTPARGVSGTGSTLETVQELSQPCTPITHPKRDSEKPDLTMVRSTTTDLDSQDEFGSPKTIKPTYISANESGNESSGKAENKVGSISASLPKRLSIAPSKPFISVGIGRGKPLGEGSSQNMTVETETVSSISQIAVGPGVLGGSGSLRVKPSSETIRPRKEKRKTVRKPPSLTSGAASSKADIFEAKVASAVDEATSSDSEETFVYESNPPESNERPRRFQSRTPSTTSMASQADQRSGVRALMDGHQIIVMKKSMKFTNSYNNSTPDPKIGDEIGKGTVRSSVGTNKGTAKHHHINSRWGRHAGNSHPSLFDDESSFPHATTSRLLEPISRHSSRPTSPRNSDRIIVNTGKGSSSGTTRYQPDQTLSERTALLKSTRPTKIPQPRYQNGPLPQANHRSSRPLLSRCKGCLALCLMMLIVLLGAVGFIYATTQPLLDVEILALDNLYASDKVLVFDLKIQARNPNLVAITIETTDLVVIAQSRFSVDSQYSVNNRSIRRLDRGLRTRDNYSKALPLDEIPEALTNLEIGHVYSLDVPLTIEGSPFRKMPSITTGQISIVNPGNNTTPDGNSLWKKILKHDFKLILRGRLNYILPFNQRSKNVSVEFRVLLTPEEGDSGRIRKVLKVR